MLIKALRPLDGHYGHVDSGQEFDCPQTLATRLIQRGVAVRAAAAPPRRTGGAPTNPGPASGPLAGSPTGAAERPSSSGVDHPRRRSGSKGSKAARPPSSSTKAGASPPGPTSSTPATTPGGSTATASPASED